MRIARLCDELNVVLAKSTRIKTRRVMMPFLKEICAQGGEIPVPGRPYFGIAEDISNRNAQPQIRVEHFGVPSYSAFAMASRHRNNCHEDEP